MTRRLLAVSGPTAAGKGSVLSVLHKWPSLFGFSVSTTTRQPRPEEIQGCSYNFVSDDEFDKLIDRGAFVEYEQVHGYSYGTTRQALESIWQAGRVAILEIDVNGARSIRDQLPSVVTVFIKPPSLEILRKRLAVRGTESKDEQEIRLARYQQEMSHESEYDYSIVNDDLNAAQRELVKIISHVYNLTLS